MPSDASNCLISTRRLSRRLASSAAKGSSSRISRGSGASARATATRCCWPPESSWGRRWPSPVSPMRSSSSGTLLPAPAAAREPEADVLGDGEVREERTLLRHVADAPAVRRDVVPSVVERLAVERDAPAVRLVEAGDEAEQRGLAGSGRSQHGGERPPVGTVRATSRSTSVAPYDLATPWTVSVLMCSSPPARRTSVRGGRSGRPRSRS